MNVFYSDLAEQKGRIDTMNIVKAVIEDTKVIPEALMNILLSEKDFFGTQLTKKGNDSVLTPPSNELLFRDFHYSKTDK